MLEGRQNATHGPSLGRALAPGAGRRASPAAWTSRTTATTIPAIFSRAVASSPPHSQPSFGSSVGNLQPSQGQQGSSNHFDSQSTSIQHHPILGDARSHQLADQLLQGYPCEVQRNSLRIDLGDEVPLTITLPMSTPDEPATMTLVPLDANSDFACQPRSSSAEASYVFRRFQVRIETATSPPTIVAPLGDVVDMGWERACRRLAEAMLARFPSDRLLHTETLPESEELEGVAIRLRNGGARFHLTPDPERGCHFFNLPGHRLLHRLIGTTRDVPDARLGLEPPGEGRWDVILRVNESRHQYDRLWYVPRPRDGDLAESARPIKRADWQPRPLRRPAPRTRQPNRRDDLLFVRRSRQR